MTSDNLNLKKEAGELKAEMMQTLANHQEEGQEVLPSGLWSKLGNYKDEAEGFAHKVFQILNARWHLRKCDLSGYQKVVGRVRVLQYGGTIQIGSKVTFDAGVVPIELAVRKGGHLEIRNRNYINYGVSITASKLVRLEEDCLLGTYVNIMDDDFHGILDRNLPPPPQPVILERNVWLGARVLVLKGVTIGHDSVVGAGSVVTKSIPPRSVAVGLPARVIKTF